MTNDISLSLDLINVKDSHNFYVGVSKLWLSLAVQPYWNFKLCCFYFFSKFCASKSRVLLIYGCGTMFKEIIWQLLKRTEILLPIRGHFILHCNFQTSAFYKECFESWSEVNGKTSSFYEEIINVSICNNRFLCYDKKAMYRRDIVDLGFVKVRDLIAARTPSPAASLYLQILNKDFFLWVLSSRFPQRSAPTKKHDFSKRLKSLYTIYM